MDWKSLFFGGGDDILKEFNIGELVMLLPKALCCLWRAINALFIRGIWIAAGEMVLDAFVVPFGGASAELLRVIKLLTWLALFLIVVNSDKAKWVKALALTVIIETVLELVINGFVAITTGTAWVIPGIGGALILLTSVIAEAAVNRAVSKEKK